MKITNNGTIMQPLGDKDVFKAMDKGAKMLEGTNWWFSAGTVLGLVRENGWIKHDTDIDAEVFISTYLEVAPIVYNFISNGYKLIRVMMDDKKPMQIAFLGEDDIIFDIYFYYDAYQENLYNNNEGGKLLMPKRFIKEKELILGYPCPSPVKEYLEARYGDWETTRSGKGDWRDDARKGGLLV